MAETTQEGIQQTTASDVKPNDNKHDNPKVNGYDTHNHASYTASDPDAQEMLISSLRSQIQDLFSQVTGLNNKLVTSYDRVSDLEDSLHVASANLRSSNIKISQLELERTEHLSALNTGLLVEKSHVTSELSRLMEKATEEAAQRGQAESARVAIEKELDDLSATLFGQANSMVAEARYAQHLSERKAEASERGLKGAEEVVQIMQKQMQALQGDKEETERKLEEMEGVLGKGKWMERRNSANGSNSLVTMRLMSSHTPYQEFLLFVAHLRTVHASTPQPPMMTALLTSPFLVRLLNEDSSVFLYHPHISHSNFFLREPTVRLDLAPSLNWLSRRSVLSAIHTGQLTIEPVSSGTLLQETFSVPTSIPGLNSGNPCLSCALCGTPIFSTAETSQSRPQSGSMASWGTALFKKPVTNSISWTNSRPPSPPRSIAPMHSLPTLPQIHIFRLAPQPTNSSISLPHHSDPPPPYSSPSQSQSPIYPLCTNGWCLARLRTTCTLWAFVRTGIVEKVWEEEMPNIVPPPTIVPTATSNEKPPVPPRRRGLWKMASALGERAASWSEGDKDKGKKSFPQHSASVSSSPAPTPPPPPPHVSVEKRRLPPPPTHPTHPSVIVAHHSPVKHAVPPPLPKRSAVRRQPSPPTITPTSTIPQPQLPVSSTPMPPVDVERSISEAPAIAAPSIPAPSPPPPPPQRSPHRPTTPANIPLPESRPHTPPIAAGATATVTATATPPPLPRRAAARGSRLTGDGPSRAGTPAAGAAPNLDHDTEPAPTKTDEDKVEDIKRDEESSLEKSEPAEVQEEEVKLKENENENGAVDGGHVELPVPLETVDKKENIPEEEEKEQEVAPSKPLADPEVEKYDTSDMEERVVDAEKAVDGNDKDWEQVQAEDVNEDKDVMSDEVKNLKSDECNEAFVGDTTWEERTWKELVRLREEMFWARIGALRH